MRSFLVAMSLVCFLVSPGFAEETKGVRSGEEVIKSQCQPQDSQLLFLAGQGCCSWHQGQCGCQNGRVVCCDGTLSPSCRCERDDVHVEN